MSQAASNRTETRGEKECQEAEHQIQEESLLNAPPTVPIINSLAIGGDESGEGKLPDSPRLYNNPLVPPPTASRSYYHQNVLPPLAMAVASERARLVLEKSVPELQELERKEIFTKDEILAIVRKRSHFEHLLSARGSGPADYARYAEWEMNLESLRRKRVKKKGVKVQGYSGRRRIFFILERGTRKFHGDISLWMQLIEFARQEKANKKLTQILTDVLRLHPTQPDLWIYASRYYMDSDADMTNARSCMQRGLRFCKSAVSLWLEYAKLEMLYLAKIEGRRRILGLDQPVAQIQPEKSRHEEISDYLALPGSPRSDGNSGGPEDLIVNQTESPGMSSTPFLNGAIPIAIFEGAMKQFNNEVNLAAQFFNLIADFGQVPCVQEVLQHIVDRLTASSPNDITLIICTARLPLVGVEPTAATFPRALGLCLSKIQSPISQLPDKAALIAEKAFFMLLPLLQNKEMDREIRKVIIASLKSFANLLTQADPTLDSRNGNKKEEMLKMVQQIIQEL